MSLATLSARAEAPAAGRLRLVSVDAAPRAAGMWRLSLAFTSDGPEPAAIRPIPPGTLQVDAPGDRAHARLRVTRTAWAQPGRVLVADVALHGATAAAQSYLLRIDCPGLVDPAGSAARFLAPEAVMRDVASAPPLDYLTKDYLGFRHAMLSTINRLLPRWTDGGEADLGVTIVESLAYAADFLSYYQDAVATEAYLDTARQHTSIRRHLRLLGYRMGEGCAGRLVVRLVVTLGSPIAIPAGTTFMTSSRAASVADAEDPAVARTLADGRTVYTQIADAIVSPELNQLELAIPGRLRAGRTHFPVLSAASSDALRTAAGGLFGIAGTTLSGEATFHPFRARAVVRSPGPASAGRALHVIEAHPDDALPCDLERGAVVVGNLVAAEFGRPIRGETLPAPAPSGRYRPVLAEPDIVPVSPVDPEASAAALLAPSPETAVAAVTLREVLPSGFDIGDLGGSGVWHPTTDLLGCSAYARRFIVEIEDDGAAALRFGDGRFGRGPPRDAGLVADYRVGRLTAAVLGIGQLDTLVAPSRAIADALRPRILHVSNPIPSHGLRHPEPEDRAILHGKAAFRIVRTCATLDDFVAAAEAVPSVAEAVASLERAGAAQAIVIRVRPTDDIYVPQPLLDAVRVAVADRMLPGRRLAVLGPRFARLALALAIRPAGGDDRDRLRDAVTAALSTRPGGLFAPDRVAFGQTVFASRILKAVSALPGVAEARVTRLARLASAGTEHVATLALGTDEIPVLVDLAIEVEAPR